MTQTYKELLAQRQALEAQIAQARARELSDAITKVRATVAEFGLTEADVFPTSKRASKVKGTAVVAKYRNPETGATWSGRGLAPKWLKDKNRDDFRITA